MTTNNITPLVREITERITGRDVIKDITTYQDPDYGTVISITVDMNAKEALDLWLKLTRQIKYTEHGVIIGVKWLGENNVSRDELIDYAVKIMVESGLKPKALEPLDIVRELQEERSKR